MSGTFLRCVGEEAYLLAWQPVPLGLLQIVAIADKIAAACMAEWSKAIDS